MKRISIKDAQKALGGRRKDVADAFGITVAAVSQWREYLPPLRALQLLEMRPDLRSKYKARQEMPEKPDQTA